ncbi:hypothetical protein MtrunA17_Chr1g0178121 [Medicago truncatula]|uniref:Transmembrane protein n=1 Tax=Medicago truncatula TaxID=3880 RepID=A0A396JMK7_MEDTR|nr:hypothetical protein MtrunA17_Chr1g0178121 [Medicago truncatula]
MIGGATSDIRPLCHCLTLSFPVIAQVLCSFCRHSPTRRCVERSFVGIATSPPRRKIWVLIFRFSNCYILISKV